MPSKHKERKKAFKANDFTTDTRMDKKMKLYSNTGSLSYTNMRNVCPCGKKYMDCKCYYWSASQINISQKKQKVTEYERRKSGKQASKARSRDRAAKANLS